MCLQEAIRLRIGRHPPRIGTLLSFALSPRAEPPRSGQTEPFKGLTPPALVQTGPSVCAPLVGTLPNGTVVTVLERCGTGRRTSGNDLTGYVYTSAFHASEPPSLSVPQQGGGVAGRGDSKPPRLRPQPSGISEDICGSAARPGHISSAGPASITFGRLGRPERRTPATSESTPASASGFV